MVTICIPIGAISGHVACISTDATDDVCCEIALFWTIVLSVTDLTTVLASLILVVSKSTIECCKLTKLIALELILAFRDRGSLQGLALNLEVLSGRTYSFNDVVNQLLRLVDLLLGVGHDQTVKIFLLIAGVSGVRSTFSFLDGALSADGNLGSGFCFHFLQGISTRTDK
jgi:hypothetical protein